MEGSIRLWVLVVPALLASAAFAGANERSPVQIHVGLCDATELSPSQLEEIQAEVGALFSPGAAEILWSDGLESCTEEAPANGPPYARAYILDALLPSIRSLFPHHKGRNVMAVTLGRSPDGPGPVIHVSRKAVEEIARLPSGHFVSRILTRAIGRVLAHELAHRFLAKASHSETGILKAVLTRDDLIYASREALALSLQQTEPLRQSASAARCP